METVTTPPTDNGTTSASGSGDNGTPTWLGFLCAFGAVVFFTLVMVPMKKYDAGDGIFYQWVFGVGTLIVGFVVNLIQGAPPFYPLVMLGGVSFMTGTLCMVPIVKLIGIAQGLCLWATINMLSGWAVGRFGLFGLKEEIPGDVNLNYVAVALAVLSALVFSSVKTDIQPVQVETLYDEPVSPENYGSMASEDYSHPHNTDAAAYQQISLYGSTTTRKRIVGSLMTIFTGVLFGQLLTPAIYVQDRYKNSSQNGLDYVFATMCGMFSSGTVYLIIYCIAMRNCPRINPQLILPGIISGIFWAMAVTFFFVAERTLSLPVSLPIVTAGVPILTALIGVVIYREVKGRRNLFILLVGIIISVISAVMTGLSK